jgi:Acetyltransferase (GNAT) domain
MNEIVVHRDLDCLDQFAEAWNCLRKEQLLFFPRFEDLVLVLSEAPLDFRVLAIREGDQITSLACFICVRAHKRYSIGERNLFNLSVRQVSLFGSAILGKVDAKILKRFLDVVRRELIFDLILFGEIPLDSPLYAALQKPGFGLVVTSPSRKTSLRWLIRLPETFEQYLTSLSSKLRKSLRYQVRKLEDDLKCELLVIHRADQIETFLQHGEAISRLTYQWNVGHRLCDNEPTRRLYHRLAKEGQLRCYLLYISGRPAAFARGELVDDTYNYETPGFDPQYSKLSVGLVLLAWVIRDLIENTTCKVFDFGQGGDEIGYKSRFGNTAVTCRILELGRWTRPFSLGLILLQEGLVAAKNLLSWIIGNGKFRLRLKKAIRKYGDT